MRSVALTAIIIALPLGRADAQEYELSVSYITSEQASDGSSSGSSRGRETYLERVVAVRADGLELMYDLPKNATAEERARVWQLPARIFKPVTGPAQLLNAAELEARLQTWLKAAKWTRADCGRWVFTWNAFRIECDPQSALRMIEAVDLRSVDLRAGAAYHDPDARAPGVLTRKAAGSGGASFTASMPIDPDSVRRARAEADVSVGELMRQPVQLDAALAKRAKESFSGTVVISFETNTTGEPIRRTRTTRIETKQPGGVVRTDLKTETVERRRL